MSVKIADKNILLISPEPWNHVFVSKHHYAVHLAERGNRVFFLNPPSDKERVAPTTFANLNSTDYRGFPSGLRLYPGWLRKPIVAQVYRNLERLCGAKFDFVWSFDNSVFFDLDALPDHVVKFSHIVDLSQDFQLRRAVRSADYCFCTSEQIKKRLSKYSDRVFKIAHGYNERFQKALDNPPMSASRVRAIYAGNLAIPYMDWASIDAIVEQHPQVDFYFLGPGKHPAGPAKTNVINRQNAYFPGEVPPFHLQAWFSKADILFVAYNQDAYRDQVANPHKMMEYLGSGKMIVATYTTEFAQYADSTFLMSGENGDFPKVFTRALRELSYWNSDALQHARRSIALDNTYEKQLGRIENIMEQC